MHEHSANNELVEGKFAPTKAGVANPSTHYASYEAALEGGAGMIEPGLLFSGPVAGGSAQTRRHPDQRDDPSGPRHRALKR
jgi:hypothetical protein